MKLNTALFLILLTIHTLPAQRAGAQLAEIPPKPDRTLVALNLPENLEIKVFVELVSRQLKVNILFDEQVVNKRITIKAAQEVPKESLMGLLESALRMKGLALVDDEQKGWKRIVQANNLVPIAKPLDPDAVDANKVGASTAVTQVFALKHADTKRVSQIIKPFMSQPGANVVELEEHGLLIITEYASNMSRLTDLIKLSDQPLAKLDMRFIPVKHMEATALAQQVNQLFQARLRAQGGRGVTAGGGASGAGVDITHDARTNQLVVIGTEELLLEATKVIQSLDVPLETVTRVYALANVAPDRIDRLAKELIGTLQANRLYRSAIDKESNLLIVTATPQIHETVLSLKNDLDLPVSAKQSPVRFYKLANATAANVLETIRLIEGGDDIGAAYVDQVGGPGHSSPPDREPALVPRSQVIPGANEPPSRPGDVPPKPPIHQSNAGSTRDPSAGDGKPSSDAGEMRGQLRSVRTKQATVTADTNTNSLIVVADPATQNLYEQLIRMLDRRRPQVLIEATIVTVDTTNGFSLGVEISRNSKVGDDGRLITFSSFGLSEIGDLGRLVPIPGAGFNGALISTDIADVVIRALANSSRARVVSAPRILVNDNATGTLSSITEEPFVSVNASDTVATTSFAGFVSAGTDVTVTPQISEGDHLKLQFAIALNSFSGAGSQGIPPPRQTNSVSSEVTIPDGHTVIVGGLNRKNWSKTKQAVPILGDIPLLEHLFSNQSTNQGDSTLFIFIRPVILRDDQFTDLKYLSQRDIDSAEIKGDYPKSKPLVIR